jgi:saccharopine dehydrogenase-like NADP-dependent oxidoreductase
MIGFAPGVTTTFAGSTSNRFRSVASAAIASRSGGSPSGGP